MQRQSLGSPVTKLHSHGVSKPEALLAEDLKRKDLPSPLVLSNNDIREEHKPAKPRRFSTSPQSPPPKPEKIVHLIPLLTVFCFLVLYLFSYTPAPSGHYYMPRSRYHRSFEKLVCIYRLVTQCLLIFLADLVQFNRLHRFSKQIGIMLF